MSEPQSFVVGEPITVEWGPWSALAIEQGQLEHVEIELDTGNTFLLPIAAASMLRLPQALLTIGTHAVRGRVARADGVTGEWTEIVFQVTPVAPGLLREFMLTRTSVPVTPGEGAEMAHAYNYLARRRRLEQSELIKLAEGFGNRPQTHAAVLAYLDEKLIEATT